MVSVRKNLNELSVFGMYLLSVHLKATINELLDKELSGTESLYNDFLP